MNKKLDDQIINFMDSVGKYLKMEYDSKYYNQYLDKITLNNLYEFVGSYYLGGSTVPETSRYVVDFMEQILWKKY